MNYDLVICTADPSRLKHLTEGFNCIRNQIAQPHEIVIVVNSTDEHIRRVRELVQLHLQHLRARVVAIDHAVGTSEARNLGIAASDADAVIFLDDDARPVSTEWSLRLLEPIEARRAVAARGLVLADWPVGGSPRWFPDELLWTVGAEKARHIASEREIRTVTGANMAWDLKVLKSLGGFDEAFSRPPGGRTFGCDEVEACLRVEELGLGRIVEVPGAEVAHVVPSPRARLRYILERCFFEGRSRSRLVEQFGVRAIDTRIAPPGRARSWPSPTLAVTGIGWLAILLGFVTERVQSMSAEMVRSRRVTDS